MQNSRIKESHIPKYGDIMPIKDWIDTCKSGGFIDSDGHGNLANETMMSNIQVLPSYIKKEKIKLMSIGYGKAEPMISNNYTHVVWFNR